MVIEASLNRCILLGASIKSLTASYHDLQLSLASRSIQPKEADPQSVKMLLKLALKEWLKEKFEVTLDRVSRQEHSTDQVVRYHEEAQVNV